MKKLKSSKPMKGARGGNTKMFSKTKAGNVKPGRAMGAGSAGMRYAGGGGNKMVGKTGSSPAKQR